MEVSTKFADTGKAYLVGLAATDDPASLGTEMLHSAPAQRITRWRTASRTLKTSLPLQLKR
jgi:hypothetical protein